MGYSRHLRRMLLCLQELCKDHEGIFLKTDTGQSPEPTEDCSYHLCVDGVTRLNKKKDPLTMAQEQQCSYSGATGD